MTQPPLAAEWLEAGGDGGFASGTVGGFRTRRYHALLLTPLTPPTGRVVLVNGFEASLATGEGAFALSTQHCAPDVTHPRGLDHIVSFTPDPWPRWSFAFPDGTAIAHECVLDHGDGTVVLAGRPCSPCARCFLYAEEVARRAERAVASATPVGTSVDALRSGGRDGAALRWRRLLKRARARAGTGRKHHHRAARRRRRNAPAAFRASPAGGRAIAGTLFVHRGRGGRTTPPCTSIGETKVTRVSLWQ